jgi:hypothetical protein
MDFKHPNGTTSDMWKKIKEYQILQILPNPEQHIKKIGKNVLDDFFEKYKKMRKDVVEIKPWEEINYYIENYYG